jgi:hypothetical protein
MVPLKATADASTRVVSLGGIATADILALFQQLLPAAFVSAALFQTQVREYQRGYASVVAMWLMVWQAIAGGRDAGNRSFGVGAESAGELLAKCPPSARDLSGIAALGIQRYIFNRYIRNRFAYATTAGNNPQFAISTPSVVEG